MLLNGTYQRFTSLSVNLLIQLLILYLLLGSSSEQFDVIATKTPIYTTVGSAVELSFHLSPETSAVNLDIQIFRSFSSQFIVYRSSQGIIQIPKEEYKERIQLVTKHLTMGKVSLLIRDVVPFDNGTYRCLFKMGINSKEGDLHLVVTALGTDPLIRMTKNQNKDLTAHCESEGWYPEPTILWKSGSGDTLEPLSLQKHKKTPGLFTVQSSITVKSGGFLSCTVQNILQNEKRKTEIFISESLYKKMNCCEMYRIFTCVLVFILTVSSMIFVSIWETRLQKTLTAKEDEMNKQLESRMLRETQNKHEIRILKRYYAASKVSVNLDPATVHGNITVSENGTSARYQREPSGTSLEDFCVRSVNALPKGILYLDLEIEDTLCTIGICKFIEREESRVVNTNDKICEIQISNLNSSDTNKGPHRLRMYLHFKLKYLTILSLDTLEYQTTEKFLKYDEDIYLFIALKGNNKIKLC